MASSLIGSINPFDCNVESWTAYEERMEQYFVVNGIKNNKKVAGLLTLVGERTYCLLRSLTVPEKPADKTYDELCEMLRTHLSPTPIVIAERFRFHKRNQGSSENVATFIAELRKLSEHCKFGTNRNDTLRDRFVCGLKDGTVQKKILSVVDLSLKKAVDIATAMEVATKDAAELQSSAAETVHAIQRRHQPKHKKGHVEKKQMNATPCVHCGRVNHASNDCKLKDALCHYCKIKGHIQSVCKKKKMHTKQNDNVHVINTVNKNRNDKILITPVVDGKPITMKLDTGSAVSLISQADFTRHFGKVNLDKATSTLKTYSGATIKQAGTKYVNVVCNGQAKTLKLCVVKENGPTLFGRDWLSNIKLDWDNIMSINVIDKGNSRQNLQSVLQRHKSVFEDGIGKVKGLTAKLTLKENVTPKFMKARSVPYSMKPKIEKELQTLEEQGIITKVDTSDWATPIVPVVKPNGSVRICGDFKVTVNQALEVDRYPLPKIEDIFANLSNGHKFSKIGLRQAYLQLECDNKSKELLTINTHKGLFRYNRLLYGVASAPAIWQRTIEQILQGIPGVQCMLDDMVITGENEQIHLENLDKVLSRLSDYGILVNKDKCLFFEDRITFCGHQIDKDGLWKTNDKIEAVLNTPQPHDVKSVRAYLGILNYYHRFLPNLATVVKPLNELLEKNRKFVWSDKCETAFKKSKHLITSEPVLTHYNPLLPVRVASDASPYGISGILSHVMPDGSEKPIAFASRSLTKAERNYAQIDRESLGIYWAVKKFYPYLYGRKFTLITDCQPLTCIFNPSKSIPATAAARIQRYAIYLSGFDYDIEYKCTKQHTNVDGLSICLT